MTKRVLQSQHTRTTGSVKLYYTYLHGRLKDHEFKSYLKQLPLDIQSRIIRYKRWQDRQSGLFGKLLLVEGMIEMGFSKHCLDKIKTNENGRPYVDHLPDFNLSHSGDSIVCAINTTGRIGVDVEKISDIDMIPYKEFMSIEEWKEIQTSNKNKKTFYDFWTKKESIIKADGRGMTIPLTQVQLKENRAVLAGTQWDLIKIDLDPGYSCHIAITSETDAVFMREINFNPSATENIEERYIYNRTLQIRTRRMPL